jgi:large subunit ribosomal protein L18
MKRITLKRRRTGKTNYHSRAKLLKSEKPRIVIRKSNRYIVAQLIENKESQDNTKFYVVSKELAKLGWTGGLKNTPAAYLTGFLIAQKSKGKIKEAIADLGLNISSKGAVIYAVIKGAKDNGLNINCDEKMMPSQERLEGKHLKTDLSKKINEIKEKIKSTK